MLKKNELIYIKCISLCVDVPWWPVNWYFSCRKDGKIVLLIGNSRMVTSVTFTLPTYLRRNALGQIKDKSVALTLVMGGSFFFIAQLFRSYKTIESYNLTSNDFVHKIFHFYIVNSQKFLILLFPITKLIV